MKYPIAAMTAGRFIALSIILPVTALHGQSTSSANQDQDSEVIVLTPFQVEANSDSGYYGTQSVSGTRTRTELINLPLSMQVFTDDFIKDTGATDLIDIVGYSSGVSANTGQGTFDGDNTNFTLRGMSSFLPMRDGFRRLRFVDSSNIERVEILKGPSSLLYGQLNPGGNVNYITKRPKPNRAFGEVTLEGGNYNYLRGIFDYNQPLLEGKIAARFVGSALDTDSIAARYHNTTSLINPSVTWWIRPATTLTVEYERSKRHEQAPLNTLPYNVNIDLQARPGAVDRTFNMATSDDYVKTDMKVFTAELVHQFNSNLTLRANYTDSQWLEALKANGRNSNLYGDDLDTLGPRTLKYLRRGTWDNWLQAELVNNFTFKGVQVQNILGYQHEVLEYRGLLNGSQVTPTPSERWNIFDPSTWVLTNLTEADAVVASSSGNTSTNYTDSIYFTNQLTLFEGQVHTLAGMRIDDLKVESYTKSTDSTSTTTSPKAKVPQIGVLYKVTPKTSLYVTYSESFLPVFSTSRHADGSYYNPVPQSGKGWDLGVKSELLDGKFAVSAAVFEISNTDIVRYLPTVTITNPDGTTETFSPTEQSGEERSKGFEFDARLRPWKGSQMIISYGYTDAYVKSDVQNPISREGHPLANAPKNTFAAFLRQDVADVANLKGVYFTLGARYVGSRSQSDTWAVVDDQAIEPPNLHAYTVVDASVGTKFNAMGLDFDASVGVKNLLDKEYLSTRYHWGEPRTVRFTLRTKF